MLSVVEGDEREVVRTADGYIPNPWKPCSLNARHNPKAEHQRKVGEYMKNQGDSGADTEVKCDGDAALLHSIVVAAHSEYFARTLREEEPPISLDLSNQELGRQGLRKAIEFMYEGRVTITAESLFQTLRGAITLEIPELQTLMETYLRQISAHPKCYVLGLNTSFQLPVSYQTRSYILRLLSHRFQTLINLRDFSLLDLEPLCAILSHPEPLNTDAMDILKTLLKWVEASCDDRLGCADRLMDLVPFSQLSQPEKVDCLFLLNQCPKGIQDAALPRLKEADWHRTCVATGQPAFSNLPVSPGIPLFTETRERALHTESPDTQLPSSHITEEESGPCHPSQQCPTPPMETMDFENKFVRSSESLGSNHIIQPMIPAVDIQIDDSVDDAQDGLDELIKRPSLSELEKIPDWNQDKEGDFAPASTEPQAGQTEEIQALDPHDARPELQEPESSQSPSLSEQEKIPDWNQDKEGDYAPASTEPQAGQTEEIQALDPHDARPELQEPESSQSPSLSGLEQIPDWTEEKEEDHILRGRDPEVREEEEAQAVDINSNYILPELELSEEKAEETPSLLPSISELENIPDWKEDKEGQYIPAPTDPEVREEEEAQASDSKYVLPELELREEEQGDTPPLPETHQQEAEVSPSEESHPQRSVRFIPFWQKIKALVPAAQ